MTRSRATAPRIIEVIGTGPVDNVEWLMGLQRLLVGGDSRDYSCRSSSLDEVLTPANFNMKANSTQGSANVPAVKLDSDGIYVQRSGARLMRAAFSPSYYSMIDYSVADITKIAPEVGINHGGITRIAIQRVPDTRIHCVRGDGTAAVLVFDVLEDVQCWLDVLTDGSIEDVFTLPGDFEDFVYYTVKRQIGGVSKRCIERWAREDQICPGDVGPGGANTITRLADSFIQATKAAYIGHVEPGNNGSLPYTIALVSFDTGPSEWIATGLSSLEGQEVILWIQNVGDTPTNPDGSIKTFLVTSGQITIGPDDPGDGVLVGLPYTAQYKSTKLAFAGDGSTSLELRKRIIQLGLIMRCTHYQGVQFGKDFDTLDNLPLVEDGQVTPAGTIWASYDKDAFTFPGDWDTDSRLCLQAQAPRPATILAAILDMEVSDET